MHQGQVGAGVDIDAIQQPSDLNGRCFTLHVVPLCRVHYDCVVRGHIGGNVLVREGLVVLLQDKGTGDFI